VQQQLSQRLAAAPILQLFLIGTPQLHFDGQPIPQFRDKKIQALFAYLAIEGRQRPIARTHLIEMLWPGYQTKSGQSNLRSTLYRLRQICLPYEPIEANRKEIRLHPQPGEFWCDWDQVMNGAPPAVPQERHPELLEGSDLPDCPAFMQWLTDQRARLRQRLPQAETRSASSSLRSLNESIPDHRHLVGRETQLAQLRAWLVEQPGRVIGIFGMGGQGKTTLAAAFARGLAQSDFDLILWSTLVNAQPWALLFPEWVETLTDAPPPQLPDHLDGQLGLLLRLARQRRTLFVLDNLETILEAGEVAGRFLPGYEAYGQFLDRMAQSAQNSAVLVTSREQPAGFARWMQSYRGVHRLRLNGLDDDTGPQLLRQYISAPAADLVTLSQSFSGNPLALLLAARTVHELFAEDVSAFLALDQLVFGDVENVLAGQFERLSPLEQQILYQLALAREPLSWPQLRQWLPAGPTPTALLDSLQSLQRRSLVESQRSDTPGFADTQSVHGRFGLQNVVMEFVTEKLVAQMAAEVEGGELKWMRRLALTRADTIQYIREMQARLILQPILQRLLNGKGEAVWASQARRLLDSLRGEASIQVGYAAVNLLHLLLLSDETIRGSDFSRLPLPRACLASAHLPEVDLRNAALHGASFTQQMGMIRSLAVHPDGRRVVTGDSNGMLWLWQIPDQKVTLIPSHQQHQIQSVHFSPDGRLLAYSSRDGRARLWDVEGEQLAEDIPKQDCDLLAFSPDSRILAGMADNEIWLWDVAAGRFLPPLQAGSKKVLTIAFTPKGDRLISSDYAGFVYVWDWRDARLSHHWQIAEGYVHRLAIHPDGEMIAINYLNQGIQFCTLEGVEIPSKLPREGNYFELAFSPSGEWLAGAGPEGHVHIWQTQPGELSRLLRGHAHPVGVIAFFPHSQWIASASADQTVRIWELGSERQLYELSGYRRSIGTLAIAPDGKTLACAGSGAAVHLWQTPAPIPAKAWAGHQGRILNLAFHPTGRRLASSSSDRSIRLWDVPSGRPIQVLWGHEEPVERILFHPHLPLLFSAAADGVVCVWQAESGDLLHKVQAHSAWISDLAVSGDGSLLVSAGGDARIALWEIRGLSLPTLRDEFIAPVDKFYGPLLALLPGGRQLAFGTMEGVYLCDLASGAMEHRFPTQRAWTMALAASPDGHWLVSLHDTKEISMWEIASGRLAWRQPLEYATEALGFGPDGARIYTGDAEGYVEVWDATNGERLEKQRIPGPYEGMKIDGITGISEAQRASLAALGAVEE